MRFLFSTYWKCIEQSFNKFLNGGIQIAFHYVRPKENILSLIDGIKDIKRKRNQQMKQLAL